MATPVSDWLRHSQLLLCDRYLEFNEIWKEARSKRPLPRLCFSGRLEKQDGHPGFWLAETFSASPLIPMNGIQQNSREARSQHLLSRLCFSGLSEEQDSRPGMWLAEAFSISPLKPLNGIQQNLTGRKISTPSNKFVFFGSIGGKRWPPRLWFAETFRLLLRDRWTRFNETWQEARSQRPLPICVIRADKKAALASDWLRHFRLLLCDRWTEFNETWQEAKFQRPLPSSCYSIDETWQEVRYQCPIQSLVFWADEKNKMAAPASDWLRHFRLLLWTEFNKTWQEIRYVNAIFQVCVFRADRKNILLMFTICGPWASCLCMKIFKMCGFWSS